MKLKLDFEMPDEISAWETDKVNLHFNVAPNGETLLVPYDGLMSMSFNYTQDLYVPKLADPSNDYKWTALNNWCYAVDYISCVFGIICLVWWFYNASPLYYFLQYLNYL